MRLRYILPMVIGFLITFQPSLAQIPDQTAGMHLVVDLSGRPQIHRVTWTNARASAPLQLGTWVSTNDLLLLQPGDSIDILCESLELIHLSAISQTPPCTERIDDSSFRWGTTDIVGLQRLDLEVYQEFSYVITPRNTQLLNGTPTFAWSPLTDAAAYNLALLNTLDGTPVWEIPNVISTQMAYPDNQPPLSPGQFALFVTPVDAFGRVIPTRADPNSFRFHVLDSSTANALIREADVLAAVSYPVPAISALVLAQFYINESLFADAVTALDALIPSEVRQGQPTSIDVFRNNPIGYSSQLYITLGDLYRAVHLPIEAHRVYDWGVEVARETGNEEALALLLFRQAAGLSGKTAIANYEMALIFYRAVGDDQMVETILNSIREIDPMYQS